MSVRKILASVALAGGLSGAGLIVANTSLVIGSTSDAGVMTVCNTPSICGSGGPIRGIPTSTTTVAPVTPGSVSSAS